VVIASMDGREQWMTLSIMQDDQFAAAQDFSTVLAHRLSRDEHVTVDCLPMAVHVEHNWSIGLVRICLPQLACEHVLDEPVGEPLRTRFDGSQCKLAESHSRCAKAKKAHFLLTFASSGSVHPKVKTVR
jgi:hypothetical protein